jgi:hypothetical protein
MGRSRGTGTAYRFISQLRQPAANRCMVNRVAGHAIPLREAAASSPTVLLVIKEGVVNFFLKLPHVLQLQLTTCCCKRAGGEADSAWRAARIRIND